MRTNTSENMDPMESFYRKSFEGFRAEPSADLLSKIQSNIPTNLPLAPIKSFWVTKSFYWMAFTATIVSVSVVLYVTQQKQNVTESAKQEPVKTEQQEIHAPISEEQVKNISPSDGGNAAVNTTIPNASSPTEKTTTDSSSVAPDKVAVNPTTTETPVVNEEVKKEMLLEENIDFYKKYSKNKKDSTRPLFVK